jgi:excisionase family DNA binding protein
MTDDKSHELLTAPRAARLLGIDRAVIYRAIHAGELRVLRFSKKARAWSRFTRAELYRWLRERQEAP